MARSLTGLAKLPWARVLLCFAALGGFDLRATAKDEASSATPAFTCQVRYHFREHMEGVKPGGKQYSAPSYEKESVVKGRVAHLPYRFVIKVGGKGAGTLEVDIQKGDGASLKGYPKTIANAFGHAGNPTTQEFDIPFAPDLARTIEKTLLAKNQHLTQVQLVVESSP